MATANLSAYDKDRVPELTNKRVALVVSEWNYEITSALCEGAFETLTNHGFKKEDVEIHFVPGSFELTLGSQFLAQRNDIDAVIAIGCVIQGETPHFDFVCHGVTQGITDLNIKFNKPVIFTLLTTNSYQQAKDRAGGKHGNKGVEGAITAIKMLDLKDKF
jgi:6,7-dimethyl-8-ribityllumazine synthase